MPPEGEQLVPAGRVPYLGGAIITPGRQPHPIPRPGHGIDHARMPPEGEQLVAAGRVPDLGGPIRTPGGQPGRRPATTTRNSTALVCPFRVCIWRPPAASHTFAVPSSLPVASRVPSGDHDTELTAPVWPVRLEQLPGGGRVPDLGRPIRTPGGQPRPIRRPGQGTERAPMAREGEPLPAAGRVPDLGGPIRTPGRQPRPVWRP